MTDQPFSHSVPVRDVPAGGKHVRLEADGEERRLLAEALNIPAVDELRADLEIRPAAGRAFRVRGTLAAAVVQTCVVTLEPVRQEIADAVDVTLLRAEDANSEGKPAEVFVDAVVADEPDFYHNGRVDLGVIVAEHLALALDPYPRAPGVDFPGHVEDDPSSDPSPFAALARLKRPGG